MTYLLSFITADYDKIISKHSRMFLWTMRYGEENSSFKNYACVLRPHCEPTVVTIGSRTHTYTTMRTHLRELCASILRPISNVLYISSFPVSYIMGMPSQCLSASAPLPYHTRYRANKMSTRCPEHRFYDVRSRAGRPLTALPDYAVLVSELL